jgi:hypothetical protein
VTLLVLRLPEPNYHQAYDIMYSMWWQGYVSTDMIANPPDEQARGWVKVWEERTPIGRYVGLTFWLSVFLHFVFSIFLHFHSIFISLR